MNNNPEHYNVNNNNTFLNNKYSNVISSWVENE